MEGVHILLRIETYFYHIYKIIYEHIQKELLSFNITYHWGTDSFD